MEADQEELEAHQEKTEAIVEHCNQAPHTSIPLCKAGLLMFYMKSLEEQHIRKLSVHLRTDLGTSIWLQGTALS
jgi:hypothetical protein